MALKDKLDEIKRQAVASIPEPALQIMARVTDDLRSSGIADSVAKPGSHAPGFSLPDTDQNPISLTDGLANGPVVLHFYRGMW